MEGRIIKDALLVMHDSGHVSGHAYAILTTVLCVSLKSVCPHVSLIPDAFTSVETDATSCCTSEQPESAYNTSCCRRLSSGIDFNPLMMEKMLCTLSPYPIVLILAINVPWSTRIHACGVHGGIGAFIPIQATQEQHMPNNRFE